MADILPKIKLYLFLTVMLVIINFGIFIAKQSMDIMQFFGTIGSSFIPFSSLITLLVYPSNMPPEFIAFAGIIIGIFSGILTPILAISIWSLIPFIND